MVALDTLIYVVGPAIMAAATAIHAIRGDGRSDDERRALFAFAFAFVLLTGAGVALATGALTVALAAVVGAAFPVVVGFGLWWRAD